MKQGSYTHLIWAIGFFVVAHVVALPALAFLIEPGFDVSIPTVERAQYITDHPIWWRLGWLPWQLSALSDIVVSVALVRWLSSLPGQPGLGQAKRWAFIGLGLNIVATIPEQIYEAILVSTHVRLAAEALSDPTKLERFADEQRRALFITSVWSASAYIAMTVAWHFAVTSAAGKPRGLQTFGGKALLVMVIFLGAVTGLVAAQVWVGFVSDIAVQISGGVGFLAVVVWSISAADHAGVARSQQDPKHADHYLRWPDSGNLRHLAGVLNSLGVRDLFRMVPFVRLRSDISDVVYLNWLVPTEQAQELLPEPLLCEDLDGMTPVSVLTYRHGSLGPAMYGPLRRLLPSPLQSNWRFYIQPVGAVTSSDSIYFFRTVLEYKGHVALARLLSDGLPAHYPATFTHERQGQTIRTQLEAGAGSSPTLTSAIVEDQAANGTVEGNMPEAWSKRFGSWVEAVTYLVDQNRGLQVDPEARVVRESTIEIPIGLDGVRPATISELHVANLPDPLSKIVQDGHGFAFVVPTVDFEAIHEGIVDRF